MITRYVTNREKSYGYPLMCISWKLASLFVLVILLIKKQSISNFFIEANVSDARIMILIMRANQTFLTQSRAIIPGRLRSIGQRVTLIFLLNLTGKLY